MTRMLGTYAAVLSVILVLDALWLGVIARPMYEQGIGHLMAERPLWAAAAAFYVVYAAGLTLFAVWPQAGDDGVGRTLLMGALFGFFAYATYDLTNLATLRGWPLSLALIDMAWGAAVSTAAAGAGKLAIDRLGA